VPYCQKIRSHRLLFSGILPTGIQLKKLIMLIRYVNILFYKIKMLKKKEY